LTNAIKSCKSKYTSATAFGWSPGLLDEWVNLFQGKDVLDYGCGYGGSSFFISNFAKSVVGVDSAKACISHCRKQAIDNASGNATFQLSSDLHLEFRDNSFDCLYSNDFIEHLHPADARLHLAEAFRVIRPGGCYLCYTPGRSSGPHDITKAFYPQGFCFPSLGSHLYEYTPFELQEFGISVGFCVCFPKSKTDILALFQKSL
jgi:ubiquinone/menaquinone biosynthesis C-methylase UbiE